MGVAMLNKSRQDYRDSIQLKRLFNKKDEILQASKEIESLQNEFRVKGNSDPDGKIEAELFKQLYTIISGLSELNAYAKDRNLLQPTLDVLFKIIQIVDIGTGDIFNHQNVLTAICISANSVGIYQEGRKTPFVTIGKLDSIIGSLVKLK